MLNHTTVTLFAALATLGFNLQPAPAADATASEVSLRVHSARVSRSTTEFNRRFSGLYTGDNRPGVNLQLLLTMNAGSMLAIPREAVTIETFVDDTYQSLLGTGNESSYSSGDNQTALSEDSRTLLFTVTTSRVPAQEAGRVFVRGSVQARMSRGEPMTATNEVSIIVGREVTIGPFRTVVQSVTDQGTGGASVTLAVEGDPSRIQKMRIMERGGGVLNVESRSRFNASGPSDRPMTTFATLRSLPKEPVTIEYTYLEKAELVRIPFEAQVDIGVTKAGPIEVLDGKVPARGGTRPWPPPRETPGESIPPRRGAFDPAANPRTAMGAAESAKLDKAGVDLFSLTVAKPPPSEAKGAEWRNPPSPVFYASGFTVARLMISTPGADIISVAPDAVTVTRFEDDKGGKLDTTLYRETSPSYATSYPGSSSYAPSGQFLRRSSDGQQALVNLSLASAPTPGATRCTLAGNIQARIGRGETTNTSPALELRNGQTFTAGPFTGRIDMIRQAAPLTPASRDGSEIELWLSLTGPVARLRQIEFLDSTGKPFSVSHAGTSEPIAQHLENRSQSFRFVTVPTSPVTVRVRHYESEEIVQVPFELSTGIGL